MSRIPPYLHVIVVSAHDITLDIFLISLHVIMSIYYYTLIQSLDLL